MKRYKTFMKIVELIITVLSSSILAAMLTSIVNWKLHNSNYRKEYYKKILDKRLEGFELVQGLTAKMKFQVALENYATASICFDQISYQNFIFELGGVIEKSFWLDESTSNKLTELNVYLYNNIGRQMDNLSEERSQDQINEKFQELGHIHWEKIRNFRKELEYLINLELTKLHKVEGFFKKNLKKNPKTFTLLK